MAKVSKVPSLVVSDDTRVPVPGLVQDRPSLARYTVTPLGHVFRDDGTLLTPDPSGKMNFNGGTSSRSLHVIIFLAFGRPELVALWSPERRCLVLDNVVYDVWVDPLNPTDPLTGRRRCTVHDVKLVPHSELVIYGQRGQTPATQLPII